MRQELHERKAPQLVRQTTTRGISEHLAFRQRCATRTEFHRRARPGAKNATPLSIRAYVDDFMQRQGKLLNAALRSQEATNEKPLRKRYANYTRLPELRRKRISDTILEEHEEPRDSPTSIAHIIAIKIKPVQPIFMALQP